MCRGVRPNRFKKGGQGVWRKHESGITHKTGMSTGPPNRSHFALGVEAPNVAHAVRHLVAKDLPRGGAHVLVAGGEDDLVGVEHLAVGEAEAAGELFGPWPGSV